MWYDNWCDLVPLMKVITHRSLYSAKLDKSCTVADMVINGAWKWPSEWLGIYPFLANIEPPLLNPNSLDKVKWVDSN